MANQASLQYAGLISYPAQTAPSTVPAGTATSYYDGTVFHVVDSTGADIIAAGSVLGGAVAGTTASFTKTVSAGLNAMGNVTGATNVDLSLGDVISMTLTGAATFTWTNAIASRGTEYTFIVTQDGTGGRIITWPAQVGGITPILNLLASGVSVFKGTYDGTNMNWLVAQNCYPKNVLTPAADTVSAPNNTTTNFSSSYTFPPNFFTAGRVAKISIGLVFTGSGGALTMAYRSTLGGVTAFGYTTSAQATAVTNRPFYIDVFIIGTATPGASVSVVNYGSGSPGANAGAWAPIASAVAEANGAITVATNGSLIYQPQFQASVNTAGNSLQLVSMVTECVN